MGSTATATSKYTTGCPYMSSVSQRPGWTTWPCFAQTATACVTGDSRKPIRGPQFRSCVTSNLGDLRLLRKAPPGERLMDLPSDTLRKQDHFSWIRVALLAIRLTKNGKVPYLLPGQLKRKVIGPRVLQHLSMDFTEAWSTVIAAIRVDVDVQLSVL